MKNTDHDFVVDIFKFYKKELEKKRRPDQVKKIITRDIKKIHLAYNLLSILKQKKLEFNIENYIGAQFFSLNYMKYLPNINHICSKNGVERYYKVKDFFKQKTGKEKTNKHNIKANKEAIKEFSKDILELKNINEYEEEDKQLSFNKVSGFEICLSLTTLYNPESSFCKKCIFKRSCIKILKAKNNNLYLYRTNKISKQKFLKIFKEKNFNE